jgi:hypothetical protein
MKHNLEIASACRDVWSGQKDFNELLVLFRGSLQEREGKSYPSRERL